MSGRGTIVRTSPWRWLWLAASPWLAAAGCTDEAATTPPAPLVGELSLELRDSAAVRIELRDADALVVTVTASAGYELLPTDTALTGDGRIERLPEAGTVLYTAKLAAPAVASGPCGAEPVSLALALHRQGSNAMVIGGLTAYCGADRWYGTPARVLRLAGELR